jgi:hypothetical protein
VSFWGPDEVGDRWSVVVSRVYSGTSIITTAIPSAFFLQGNHPESAIERPPRLGENGRLPGRIGTCERFESREMAAWGVIASGWRPTGCFATTATTRVKTCRPTIRARWLLTTRSCSVAQLLSCSVAQLLSCSVAQLLSCSVAQLLSCSENTEGCVWWYLPGGGCEGREAGDDFPSTQCLAHPRLIKQPPGVAAPGMPARDRRASAASQRRSAFTHGRHKKKPPRRTTF